MSHNAFEIGFRKDDRVPAKQQCSANEISRRASLGMALALLGAPLFPAFAGAQQQRVYIFAWAYERDSTNVYISDGLATAPSASYGKEEAVARWRSALLRRGVSLTKLSMSDVGTPHAIDYTSARAADDARYEFGNTLRKQGKNVIWVSW